MAANDVRKAMAVFVDGKGYAGNAEEFNAPKLARKLEDFRAGGMNGSLGIDLGMDGTMESDFSLVSYSADVLSLFGLAPGNEVPLVVREALQSHDGTVTAVMHSMRGVVKELDSGTSKPGEKPMLKVTMSLTYYKMDHGGRTLQEIDIPNMVHVVNGVDQLAAQRAALGI